MILKYVLSFGSTLEQKEKKETLNLTVFFSLLNVRNTLPALFRIQYNPGNRY